MDFEHTVVHKQKTKPWEMPQSEESGWVEKHIRVEQKYYEMDVLS